MKKDLIIMAARIMIGLIISVVVFTKLWLWGGLPRSDNAWVLLILGLGYLIYTLIPNTRVSIIFSVICVISGVYLMTQYYPLPIAGILLVVMGLLNLKSELVEK